MIRDFVRLKFDLLESGFKMHGFSSETLPREYSMLDHSFAAQDAIEFAREEGEREVECSYGTILDYICWLEDAVNLQATIINEISGGSKDEHGAS